jgi:signal transduction histidine kinase
MNLPEKILVVEDEPVTRMNIQAFLKGLGFEVIEASQGEAALESGLKHHPDLVLLDINLPGQSGFEVCRKLKAIPELQDTPVIFLSGLTETDNTLEAFAVGGLDYISKPFNFKELEARIRIHLEIQAQRRQLEHNHRKLQDALSDIRQVNHKLIEVNERLRLSEEVKSHFIANMRNEINDPLASILGLADEICDPRLPVERSRALANLIKTEAFQLEFELRNIFCAAELESGEASPSITKVDVDSMLQDAAMAFTGKAQEKAQTIDLQVAEGSSLFATDAGMLQIILGNLLANAIEFSPVGGRIELRAFPSEAALVIEVEDRGAGLREADKLLIFERFRQLDTGLARSHRGQGLGLAVVKALVELLEGQLSVDSQLGRGSKFVCRLPSHFRTEELDTSSLDGNLFIFDEPREL